MKISEGRSEPIGKKKDKKVVALDMVADQNHVEEPQPGKTWKVSFEEAISYDKLIKMSAESILEAMHIASATGSVDGMLNASVQWGELAAFVKDTEDGKKMKFGFASKEDSE